MNLEKKITICVFTHIIEASTNPHLDNRMLIDTIKSTSEVLNLKEVKYQIYIDAAMKRLYPELYLKYVSKIQENLNNFIPELDVEIVKNTGETLRGNWECAMNNIDTPYMMFLEHDWKFIYDVKIKEIIKTLDEYKEISYLKFSRFPLDGRPYPSHTLWEVYFETENSLPKATIPLTRISFWSGNPHIMRVDTAKEFYIPLLEMNTPKDKAHGLSFLERDIKPLTERCIKEHGMEKTHSMFGTYMYGKVPYPPVIEHTGDWCRKK